MNLFDKPFTVVIVVIWNVITFLMYGLDKTLAKNNMWRISEKVLLTSAVALGGVGAFFGMRFFRHKTKHSNFNTIVPIGALITIIFIIISN